MTADLRYLAWSAALAWVMLMTASFMRTRAWNRTGLCVALGNRAEVPEPSAAAGRADRAARNMLENFVLFAALLLAARAGGVSAARLELAAAIFFWARLAYFPAYVGGIPYLRTLLWAIGVVALAMVFAALW
jgi:uncharacterized MAPEG superfamily protein